MSIFAEDHLHPPIGTVVPVAESRTTRTIVFCDVVASTALRQRLGDNAADQWFSDLFERIQLAVVECEGVVTKWLGDGAMAVFASAGGALDAAVRMQEVASAPGPHTDVAPAHLRIGVSIGDVGRTDDDDWIGLPVVEAARLCDKAGADEIFASDVVRVMAGNRSAHDTEPMGDYELKGLPHPISVVRVGWSPPAPLAARAFPPSLEAVRQGPFVGRRALLAELHHTWSRGAWRALVVSGEPGIGKTRLVAELTHLIAVSGGAVVLGRCDPEITVDYRPWVDALSSVTEALSDDHLALLDRDVVAELAVLVPVLGRRLGITASSPPADADTRHALLAEGAAALLTIAAPVVVVVDDIQWTDRRSLQLVRYVIERGLDDVAVVATYRDTDVDDVRLVPSTLADLRRVDDARWLALEGLDSDAVVDMLAHAAGGQLDVHEVDLAQQVHDRTSGNPLFVGELARHLAETGALGASATDRTVAASTALPDGLREVIRRRVTTLGSEVEKTLLVAAAVGPWFDLEVVEETATLAGYLGRDVLTHLEIADEAGIVAEAGDGFDFRHAVIRDVLLDDLSAARRRRLHRDVGAVLEKKWERSLDRHVNEIAYQHSQARTPEAPGWQLRASIAAIEALDSAAAAIADRGLELLSTQDEPDPVLECELLIARANGKRLAGAETLQEATVAFAAARSLGEPDRMARALLTLSIRSTAQSQVEHVAFLSNGLTHLDDPSLLSHWGVAVAIAVREGFDAESDPAIHRERIAAVVPHLDPGDVAASQLAMRCARSLASSNQPRDALAISERFAGNCGGIDNEGFPIEVALSTMWLHLGDRDRSDHYLDVAASDRRRGYWFYDCQVLQREAMRALLDGRWNDAADHIDAVARIGGHDQNLTLSCAQQQSWLNREFGELDRNLTDVDAYLAAFPDFAAIRCLQVGEWAEAGRVDAVCAALDQLSVDDFRSAGRGWLTLLSIGNLAWAAIAVDATEHAVRLRRVLEPMAGQLGVIATGTNVMCAVDRLLAGLAALEGRHAEADALFDAALAQEQTVRSRPLQARTRHWWGRALVRRGDDAAARPHIDAAHDIASDLDMKALVAQLENV